MNEVTKVENAVVSCESQYDRILELAINQGAPLEKLEKYLELRREHEAYEAKKAFTSAMAAFKKNPPKIAKDKHVQFNTKVGQTSYRHVTIGNVTEKINSGLGAYGLHASWRTEQTDRIKVTCIITHDMGHSESTSLMAPPDDSGGKNHIQAIGSTVSYLERYTLLALTGLATYEQDDDGQSAEIKFITTDQATEINDFLKANYKDAGKAFLAVLKCESVEKIPADKYKNAVAMMEKVKNANRA